MLAADYSDQNETGIYCHRCESDPCLCNNEFYEKLEYTKELIRCWVESWGVDGVYVAYSGGLDSEVLLHIARSLYPDIKGVFNNTGLELPEILKQVRTHENIDWLRPVMPFHKVIEKYGWPVVGKEQAQFIRQFRTHKSMKTLHTRYFGNSCGRGKISKKWRHLIYAPFKISEQCCDKLKKDPSKRYEKKTGRKPMLGVMSGESQLRKQRRHICNLYDAKRPVSKPLTKWCKAEIWEYIKLYFISYCEAYDQGWDRTGCIFCLYGIEKDNPNRFEMIKEIHPKLYDYSINKLGAGKILDYLGIKY